MQLFDEAKNLFEKLEATDDEMYPIVLSNIKYAQEKQMDQLIKEIADSIPSEETDDE